MSGVGRDAQLEKPPGLVVRRQLSPLGAGQPAVAAVVFFLVIYRGDIEVEIAAFSWRCGWS